MAILFAIFGLCLLIVVHEAGHMFVARLFGMRVEKFSIFFGPAVLRWRGRETTYQLGILPLGGYVQIAGMNPHEPQIPGDTGSYAQKSAWARAATIFAGPLTNYLLAIVLIMGVMLVWGAPTAEITPTIAAAHAGGPAAQAGLRSDDRVVAVDGTVIASGQELIEAIVASGGKPLTVRIARDQAEVDLVVTPEAAGQGFRIGVTLTSQLGFLPLTVRQALLAGISYPVTESLRILGGLKQIVTGRVGTDQVGGIVEIVRQLKLGFEHSVVTALAFLAMLSVVLGLFNLLPIPALDGGRLVFLTYNIVTGHEVNQKFETIVHTIGFVLLLALLLLVNFRDVLRLVGAD